MPSAQNPAGFDEAAWITDQVERYSPVLGGEALRQFLGFRTAAAFQKARYAGGIEVSLFALPGRQGLFALTQEACEWLIHQRRSAQRAAIGPMPISKPHA